MTKPINILVSSAGRRGALISLVRDTLRPLGGRVFAIDAGQWSSACRLADDWALVPRCDADNFIDAVIDICRRRQIRHIIPTIDPGLTGFADTRAVL